MKTTLMMTVLLSGLVVASAAQAGQPLPAGDPQEARYRKLLQRWDTADGCETAMARAERARAEAMRPVLEKMTPEERKSFEIRGAAARETWESLTPEQQKKVLIEAHRQATKGAKMPKKQ